MDAILLVALILCTTPLVFGNECKTKLLAFKSETAKFTECTLGNNICVPVNLCLQCHQQYLNFTNSYLKLRNGTNVNTTCEQIYFNQDRLNVVENVYLNSEKIWNEAFCSTCFNSDDTILSDVLLFTDQNKDFEVCCQNLKNKTDVCKKCKDKYVQLNDGYAKIKETRSGLICFDIQDMMNRSRSMWSKDYGCCKRVPDIRPFAFVSSIFLCFPLMFYAGFYFYTKRIERNHEMLININRGNDSVSQTTSEPRHTIEANEPRPSTSYQEENFKNPNTKKLDTDLDDDQLSFSSSPGNLLILDKNDQSVGKKPSSSKKKHRKEKQKSRIIDKKLIDSTPVNLLGFGENDPFPAKNLPSSSKEKLSKPTTNKNFTDSDDEPVKLSSTPVNLLGFGENDPFAAKNVPSSSNDKLSNPTTYKKIVDSDDEPVRLSSTPVNLLSFGENDPLAAKNLPLSSKEKLSNPTTYKNLTDSDDEPVKLSSTPVNLFGLDDLNMFIEHERDRTRTASDSDTKVDEGNKKMM